MKILYLNKTRKKISKKFFEKLARKGEKVIRKRILTLCGQMHGLVLSLTIIHDREMALINEEWRGKKGSTDVLSFSFAENFSYGQSRGSMKDFIFDGNVGDILISVDMIAVQARKHGVSFGQELSKMFIHSFLHIFGYDHKTVIEEREMEATSLLILP